MTSLKFAGRRFKERLKQGGTESGDLRERVVLLLGSRRDRDREVHVLPLKGLSVILVTSKRSSFWSRVPLRANNPL